MSLRDVKRELADVLLSAIDPPTLDARIDRDPDKLAELAHDIGRKGVILPLAVVRDGDRYEIIDGHRRYLAAQLAELVKVPCSIWPSKEDALEGVKYAANMFREDMSPAEEAVFFHELFTRECGEDIDRVAAMVNRKVSYVDARLALLHGAEDIFEAVRARTISLGVAAQLNTIPDPLYRTYYLEHAIKSGATVSVVTGWVTDWRNTFGAAPASHAPAIVPTETVPAGSFDPHRCYLCQKNDPRFIPESVSIHTHCRLALLDPMLAASRGED